MTFIDAHAKGLGIEPISRKLRVGLYDVRKVWQHLQRENHGEKRVAS